MLAACVYDWPDRLGPVHVYTDGSYKKDNAGAASWAFVVLTEVDGTTYLLGFDFGLCHTDPLAEGWFGSAMSDSRAGETGAQIRSIEWIFPHALTCDIFFRFDALAIGLGAAGRMNIQQGDTSLRLLRSLVLALQCWTEPFGSLNWEHVKVHSGIFGNELADGLARYATDTQQEFNLAARPDYLPYVTGPKLSIEHFWLYFTGMNSSRELPAFEEGKLRVVRISPLPGGRVPVPEQMLQMQSSDLESRDRKVNLFLCSYNVGTLAPREPGVKIQYLREQLDAHGVTLAFLQETRTRTSQMVTSATHVRVTSAANSGVGGI